MGPRLSAIWLFKPSTKSFANGPFHSFSIVPSNVEISVTCWTTCPVIINLAEFILPSRLTSRAKVSPILPCRPQFSHLTLPLQLYSAPLSSVPEKVWSGIRSKVFILSNGSITEPIFLSTTYAHRNPNGQSDPLQRSQLSGNVKLQ